MLKFAIILAAVSVCYGQVNNRYYLYTESNPVNHVVIEPIGNTISDHFKPANPTTILIHGYGESVRSAFNMLTRSNLVTYKGPHNVIVVDWETLAGYSYSNARSNARLVGDQLATFIRWLTGLTFSRAVRQTELHLVGFGLGAHVAGIASRQLENGVGRITGLDPSGSGWGANSLRLNPDDAAYVEVIHTDGSGLFANGIGTEIGRVNFYANGGSSQPGCLTHSCCHDRAYQLFAASIEKDNHLMGVPCRSKTQMNLNLCSGSRLPLGGTTLSKLSQSQSHIYRINTGRTYPF